MAGEWRDVEFRDLMLLPTRNGIHKGPAFQGRGVPVIKMGEVYHSDVLGDLARDRLQLSADEVGRLCVQKDDLLFCRTSLVAEGVGYSALVGQLSECSVFASNLIRVRIDSRKASARFWYYYFRSPLGKWQLLSLARGTSVTTITGPDISALQVSAPNPEEQHAIAHKLGTLDDKIELNRQMSKSLEAMARALFKSWFVDFDPVRTKAEGREPTPPKPLAGLFPDSFRDTEIGHQPHGWTSTTVEALCTIVTRGVTPEYEEGSGRYIINQRVNQGSQLDWTALKELSSSLHVPGVRLAKRWDVLVNCLGEGTLGRVHLFTGPSNVYAIDQHMTICRGATPSIGCYLYQVLASREGQDKIESLKTGSTGMTMLNISKLRSFEILWPGSDLADSYFRNVEPLWDRVASNEAESLTLRALRDALLPELISGAVRVFA